MECNSTKRLEYIYCLFYFIYPLKVSKITSKKFKASNNFCGGDFFSLLFVFLAIITKNNIYLYADLSIFIHGLKLGKKTA